MLDFSPDIGGIINGVGNIIDDLNTSEEEKENIKLRLKTLELEHEINLRQMELEDSKDVTQRWTSDNANMISRLVRPSAVIWVLLLLTVIILGDGNIGSFHIKEAYMPMIETFSTTVVVSYFGSRGVEKVSKIFTEKKEVNARDWLPV